MAMALVAIPRAMADVARNSLGESLVFIAYPFLSVDPSCRASERMASFDETISANRRDSVVILVLLVQLIQGLGDRLVKRVDHR